MFSKKEEPEASVEAEAVEVEPEEVKETPEERHERKMKEKEEREKEKEERRKEKDRKKKERRKEKKQQKKERRKEKKQRKKEKVERRKARLEEEEEDYLDEHGWDGIVHEVEVEDGIREKREEEDEESPPGAGKVLYRKWRGARKERKWKLTRNTLIAIGMLIFGLMSLMSQWWYIKKEPCCILNGGFWILIGVLVLYYWGLHFWNFFRKRPMPPRKYWEELGIEEDEEEEDKEG